MRKESESERKGVAFVCVACVAFVCVACACGVCARAYAARARVCMCMCMCMCVCVCWEGACSCACDCTLGARLVDSLRPAGPESARAKLHV